VHTITAATKIVGIIGKPVGHSLSPVMHNTAFRCLGLDFVYLACEVHPDWLERGLKGAAALGFCGVNVTIPYKEKVLSFMDTLSPEAELIGAVNTIVVKDGKLHGYNTDGEGFLRSLKEEANISLPGKSFMILGAGGAARAVAVTLALNGAGRLYLANRTLAKADAIAALIVRKVPGCQVRSLTTTEDQLKPVLKEADIIINATPIGMYPDIHVRPDLNPELIRPESLVCDLVYHPVETAFLRGAAQKGCRTLSGLGMLVYQGAIAFRLWTGLEAPVAQMYQVINTCLS